MKAVGLRDSRQFFAELLTSRKQNCLLPPPPFSSGAKKIYGGGWTRTNGGRSRGIYSPLQLPLCDTPKKMMLAKGLEPSTIRLQVGRSTS